MQKGNDNNKPFEKIWYGPRKPMQLDEKHSLGQVLFDNLLKDPEHIAQICCHNGNQYTNLQIADLAINIARNFKKLGLRQGDIVGFCANNTDFVWPLVIATQLNALILSTLHPSLESDGIKHILSITKPQIMFCDGSNFERVKQAITELKLSIPIYTMEDHIDGVPKVTDLLIGVGSQEPFSCESLEKGYLQTAAIFCSSGTTGLPKGVCLTHAGLHITDQPFAERGDKVLNFSTMAWATALKIITVSISSGFTLLITKNGFSVEEFFEIIDKYKPSTIYSTPSQIALLVRSKQIHSSDMSFVKNCFCSGAALAATLVNEIKPFLAQGDISVGYGLTELPRFRISSTIFCENQNMGKLSTNVELKILNDEGESLDVNETGEIVARSELPFTGYYGNEAATMDICDKDGWLHTGDIGYVNEREELFVIDRKKDILKCMGFHFSLTEIENVIIEIPDVLEVCVCGIPDDVFYCVPAAMVVLKPDSLLKEEDIYKYVSEKMEFYKHLRGGVYFVQDIPKTPSDKKIRRDVLALCEKMRNHKIK